jgi:hypothetical protein
MIYKIFADIIVIIHFIFIIFMLLGFIFTIWAFFWRQFYDWCVFRTLHLFGILYVTLLAVLREYCPLTILENSFRLKYHPATTYFGSFIARYIERLVYPDVNPLILLLFTIFFAIFTLVIFIINPPSKIKEIFRVK